MRVLDAVTSLIGKLAFFRALYSLNPSDLFACSTRRRGRSARGENSNSRARQTRRRSVLRRLELVVVQRRRIVRRGRLRRRNRQIAAAECSRNFYCRNTFLYVYFFTWNLAFALALFFFTAVRGCRLSDCPPVEITPIPGTCAWAWARIEAEFWEGLGVNNVATWATK